MTEWTPDIDAVALALYAGALDYMEAHRRTGMNQRKLRRRAYALLRQDGRPTRAERNAAAALPPARRDAT